MGNPPEPAVLMRIHELKVWALPILGRVPKNLRNTVGRWPQERLNELQTQAIRARFQPPVVSALARTKGWVLEGGAQHLLIYRPGKRLAPDQVRRFLDDTGRIAQLFA